MFSYFTPRFIARRAQASQPSHDADVGRLRRSSAVRQQGERLYDGLKAAYVARFIAVARRLCKSPLESSTPQTLTHETMKTEEIANRLVALCRESQWETAQQELYAADAVSIEPYDTPGCEKETRGLPGIIEKGRQFSSMVETMHSLSVSDPLVAENSFACTMHLDTTMKGQGRMKMSELCVYEVKDGKIVSESFHV